LTETDCPEGCPGCVRQRMTTGQCLAEKLGFAHKTLAPWQPVMVQPETAPEHRQWGYRNKVCLSAIHDGRSWRIGLKRRDIVLSVPRCRIHSPGVRDAMALFAGILPPAPSFPLVFYVQSNAQITLVVKSARMPEMNWLTGDVKNRLLNMGIEGLWLCLHPSAGHRVFAKNGWRLVWGNPRSMDARSLVYGPTTFGQPIVELAEAVLNRAEHFLNPAPGDQMVDLYCGIGAGLARWKGKTSHVTGVELSGESVDCARQNAPGATILRGMCRLRLPQLTAALEPNGHRCLVYANPPRTGMEPEVVRWLADTCRPEQMACLSCNPVTLKQDLALLEKNGYGVDRLVPFDFFPNTRHLEILALLHRV